jgi:hypothetical protein
MDNSTWTEPDGTAWIKGRATGAARLANQVPGMPHAICHACGLGWQCADEDCPNDTPAPTEETSE